MNIRFQHLAFVHLLLQLPLLWVEVQVRCPVVGDGVRPEHGLGVSHVLELEVAGRHVSGFQPLDHDFGVAVGVDRVLEGGRGSVNCGRCYKTFLEEI